MDVRQENMNHKIILYSLSPMQKEAHRASFYMPYFSTPISL